MGLQTHTKLAHLELRVMARQPTITPVSCELCMVKLANAQSLKAHLKRTHMPKDHKCSHCYGEFSTVTELNCHILKAHSLYVAPDFKCKICSKQCKDLRGLATHSQFHGNPTLSCGQCSLTFFALNTLSLHLKLAHTLKFPMPLKNNGKAINYTCAVCCRPCGLKKDCLRLHLRVHYPKLDVCPVCQEVFKSEISYRAHMRQNHPVSIPSRETIRCVICSKVCPTQERYLRHLKYNHEKPTLSCPDCPLLFYTTGCLHSHSNFHKSERKSAQQRYRSRSGTLGCAICTRMFPSRFLLQRHLTKHNPLVFDCSRCNFQCHSRFTIKRHLQNFH